MKVGYEKPTITFEEYELNAAIAAGCQQKVNVGPVEHEGYDVCDDYKTDLGDDAAPFSLDPLPQPFWDAHTCSCDLSAGGTTLLMS